MSDTDRELLANWMIKHGFTTGHGDTMQDLLAALSDHIASAGKMVWRSINTFDGSMFSLMTNGTPDTTEVVKYKGAIPEWATHWMPLPEGPKDK